MNTRIIPHAVSLVLLLSAPRAEAVSIQMPVAPEIVVYAAPEAPEVAPEVVPQVAECGIGGNAWNWEVPVAVGPFTGEEPVPGLVVTGEEIVPEIIVCPGVDEPIDVELVTVPDTTPEMVQRDGTANVDDGEVTSFLVYANTGAMNFGGIGSGASGLEQGLAGSGLEAVAALKLEVADVVVAKREVKVLASAGDVVISD